MTTWADRANSHNRLVRAETAELLFLCCRESLSGPGFESIAHYFFRLAQNCMEVCFAVKTLRVNFVDVLRAGRPCREPAALCYYFKPANGGLIAWRLGQLGNDGFARQIGFLDTIRRQFLQ